MMPEVLKKIFLSHVRAPLGSELKSLKKVKKIDFFQMIFFLDFLDTIGVQ